MNGKCISIKEAGIILAKQYLSETGGNTEAALILAQRERMKRDWESITHEGMKLRVAENYLTAYWAVSKKQFLLPETTWLVYAAVGIPGQHAVHVVIDAYNWWTTNVSVFKWMRNIWDPIKNDPASLSALAAGYAGATDALLKYWGIY